MKTGALCVAPPCDSEAVWCRSEALAAAPMCGLCPQEGSGFDDFDSDDEVLRVSELLLDLHLHYKLNVPLTSPLFFLLSRGRRVLVDRQDCRGPQEPRLKTSSLDHPVLLGEMAGMESAAPPAHP